MITPFVLAALLVTQAVSDPNPGPSTPAAEPAAAAAGYVPERVFNAARRRFTDFEIMLADLAYADVIFVGEQHDDPNTHRLELAMLDGLARRRGGIILSLEMFERDVQPVLDDYLAGRIEEEEFLKQSRPWPRYRTDYRPLVEFARARGWTVVAGNVPRPLAGAVSKTGLAHLDSLPADQRAHAAGDLQCPFDSYFDRFRESMDSHPMPGDENKSAAEKRAATERLYFAQCVKDETMAESIAQAWRNAAGTRPLVVHFNGAFHSDFGWGAASRTGRRLAGARLKLVTVMPVADLDRLEPSREDRRRADYLVYTYRPPPAEPTSPGR